MSASQSSLASQLDMKPKIIPFGGGWPVVYRQEITKAQKLLKEADDKIQILEEQRERAIKTLEYVNSQPYWLSTTKNTRNFAADLCVQNSVIRKAVQDALKFIKLPRLKA